MARNKEDVSVSIRRLPTGLPCPLLVTTSKLRARGATRCPLSLPKIAFSLTKVPGREVFLIPVGIPFLRERKDNHLRAFLVRVKGQ